MTKTNGINKPTLGIEALFGKDHDAASFRCFVCERGQLRRIREFLLRYAGGGNECRCLPVTERDRAGLVEQEHIDITGRFDGTS